MKLPSDSRVPTPYLPIVNAIAPNAPIGASFMIKPTMRKKMWLTMSMRRSTGSPCSPSACKPKANRIAKNRTWRISPVAKAPTTVDGMISIRNPMVLWSFAFAVKVAIDLVSTVERSTFMPTPGCHRLTTISPITRASVVTTSK